MKLDDPRTIRLLIRICVIGLILLAGVDIFFHHHEHFAHQGVRVDAWPFFYPVYGFVVCVLMVWGAKKLVATVLMRPDTYYAEDAQRADDPGEHEAVQPTDHAPSVALSKDGA